MRYLAAALLLILAYLAWHRPSKPEAVWTGWRDLERVDSV